MNAEHTCKLDGVRASILDESINKNMVDFTRRQIDYKNFFFK